MHYKSCRLKLEAAAGEAWLGDFGPKREAMAYEIVKILGDPFLRSHFLLSSRSHSGKDVDRTMSFAPTAAHIWRTAGAQRAQLAQRLSRRMASQYRSPPKHASLVNMATVGSMAAAAIVGRVPLSACAKAETQVVMGVVINSRDKTIQCEVDARRASPAVDSAPAFVTAELLKKHSTEDSLWVAVNGQVWE